MSVRTKVRLMRGVLLVALGVAYFVCHELFLWGVFLWDVSGFFDPHDPQAEQFPVIAIVCWCLSIALTCVALQGTFEGWAHAPGIARRFTRRK